MNNMEYIAYDDFSKVALRVAKVIAAVRVEGSEKLLKLRVSLGEEERQIVAGIGKNYSPEEMVGRQIVIIANLAPRTLMGLESQGMLLAAEGPVLLRPDLEVEPGSEIR